MDTDQQPDRDTQGKVCGRDGLNAGASAPMELGYINHPPSGDVFINLGAHGTPYYWDFMEA